MVDILYETPGEANSELAPVTLIDLNDRAEMRSQVESVPEFMFLGALRSQAIALDDTPQFQFCTRGCCYGYIKDRVSPGSVVIIPQEPLFRKGRVDFTLYYGSFIKVVVEIDGHRYHSTPEQKQHDRRRDIILTFRGYRVFRFPASLVHSRSDECVDEVLRWVLGDGTGGPITLD